MLSPPLTPSRSFHISTSLPTQLHALSIDLSLPYLYIYLYLFLKNIKQNPQINVKTKQTKNTKR